MRPTAPCPGQQATADPREPQSGSWLVSSPEFAVADPRWRDTLVAGVVQHFAFSFEICWKTVKRQLEREVVTPSDLGGASLRELRNIASHTYAREKALQE